MRSLINVSTLTDFLNGVFTVWTGEDGSHVCNYYPNTYVLRAVSSQEKAFQGMSWAELPYYICTVLWFSTRQSPSVQLQFDWKDLKPGTSFPDWGKVTIKRVTIYRTTLKQSGSRGPWAFSDRGLGCCLSDSPGLSFLNTEWLLLH